MVTRKTYNEMKMAYQMVIEQQRWTIEAKDQVIEAYKREVVSLEARLRRATERRDRNQWRKKTKDRPKLTDTDLCIYNKVFDDMQGRDEHNPYPEDQEE